MVAHSIAGLARIRGAMVGSSASVMKEMGKRAEEIRRHRPDDRWNQ